MTWLLNTWYPVSWSTDIAEKPLGRTLLNIPVVFFRREDGVLAAIGGRCPHRFAPLSMGRVSGDCIECPYHGLRFNADGICVLNPHGDGKIPKRARVPGYPVQEKWGLVWFWPGEPAMADPASIPDLSYLQRTDLGHVCGELHMSAHYQLGIDNLIDLSHAQFVHGDRLMSDRYDTASIEVCQDGDDVVNRIFIAHSSVPATYRQYFDDPEQKVDYWLDARWKAPCVVINDIGVTLPGKPREAGYRSTGLHIVTPETERTAHYLYCNSRNRRINDSAVDEKVREWQRVGFSMQDKPVIEAAALMMDGQVDPLALQPVLLPIDAGAIRARRILAKMIDAERQARAEVPASV